MNYNLSLGPHAEVYHLAATGSLEAQRLLADSALQTRDEAARSGGYTELSTIEAVFWSRLASGHGDERDAMRLSEALAHAGNVMGSVGLGELALGLTAEAVAIVRTLANDGYDEAIRTESKVLGNLTPAVIQRANQLMEAANAQSKTHA